MQHVLAIFVTVFLDELGDKTQLVTLLYATGGQQHPVLIFLAAAPARWSPRRRSRSHWGRRRASTWR